MLPPVQDAERLPETSPGATQQAVGWYAAVLEDQLDRIRGPQSQLAVSWTNVEPGGAGGDDQVGEAPDALLAVGDGGDDIHAGERAVGDETLGAVDHPLAVIEAGRGLDSTGGPSRPGGRPH